jgi:FKBP-type peptidyl-prolyl cis-trans isomerase
MMKEDGAPKIGFDWKKIMLALVFIGIFSAMLVGVAFGIDRLNNRTANDQALNFDVVNPDEDNSQEVGQVKIEDIQVGDGDEVKDSDVVTVNYVGTLEDGTKFDSSYDRNEPFDFTVGKGEVIQGWDQGLLGMKVGGKRKLTIPPELGYGSEARGNIPANSTLIFEIELLGIK